MSLGSNAMPLSAEAGHGERRRTVAELNFVERRIRDGTIAGEARSEDQTKTHGSGACSALKIQGGNRQASFAKVPEPCSRCGAKVVRRRSTHTVNLDRLPGRIK
jgi:hypothetical protein